MNALHGQKTARRALAMLLLGSKAAYRRSVGAAIIALALAATAAVAANDRGFFWEVKSKTATVYLLGSIHLAKPDLYPLRPEITAAFDASNYLVVEADLNALDPMQTQLLMLQYGMYPGAETLRDHVSADTWRALQQYLQSKQLPELVFAKQKPGMLMSSLTSMQMISLGFSPELGIDHYFLQRARGTKTILELESVEAQFRLLAELPNPDLVVQQTLEQLHAVESLLDDIIATWKQGDDERLLKLLYADDLQKHPEFKPIYQRLFDERNHSMAVKAQGFLAGSGTYFMVVGAGHLIGPGSVTDVLRRAGYAVERR